MSFIKKSSRAVGRLLCVACTAAALATATSHAQSPARPSNADVILKADSDFARSVADRDRQAFLSFIAEHSTFNGGTPNEIHGRGAVMKEWDAFFRPDGPTLTWAPIRGELLSAGDVGYTVGRSVHRSKGADGKVVERRGEYLTAWRKQADGSWKVVFDTGSTLP